MQDDTSSLDWRNWTFLGNSTYVNGCSESSNSSVLDGSVECLNFEKILSTLNPAVASNFHNASTSLDSYSVLPENLQEAMPSNSTLSEEQTISASTPKDAKVVYNLLFYF
jgi:hypothetical protein